MGGETVYSDEVARETARIEKLAMDTVMEVERRLGYEPFDVSSKDRTCAEIGWG